MTKKQSDASTEVLGGFRVAFYLLLSRAFSRELNEAVLKNMEQISGTLMEVWVLLGLPSDPDIEVGRALLKTFFAGLKDDHTDNMAQGLAREYASLFLGVGGVTVSPCESVYRSASGLLYQSALFEVEQSYREIGMAKSDLYQEPDDHIAVELSYMARLCEMTQEAADVREQALRYLGLQQGFLDAHLLQWVPLFSQRLIAAAPSGFYRAMAHLLKGYAGVDNKLIEAMTQGLRAKHGSEIQRRQKENKHL